MDKPMYYIVVNFDSYGQCPDEVASILGCSERNVYRNIQSGKLEAVEREILVPQVKKMISEEALEKYKKERGIE